MVRCSGTQKGGGMGGLNGMMRLANRYGWKILPALSLIEIIVASVIFLTVFMISLHTVVSLTIHQKDDTVYIVADMSVKDTLAEYIAGNIDTSLYEKEYSWGNITGRLDPYGDYHGIEELTLVARLSPDNREMIYKYLIERRHE